MKKTFKLIHSITGEVVMYGESERVCRIYAVKYEYAIARITQNEYILDICRKANIEKNFYRLHLDKHYTIEEMPPIKIYSLYEVNLLNEDSLVRKIRDSIKEK